MQRANAARVLLIGSAGNAWISARCGNGLQGELPLMRRIQQANQQRICLFFKFEKHKHIPDKVQGHAGAIEAAC